VGEVMNTIYAMYDFSTKSLLKGGRVSSLASLVPLVKELRGHKAVQP
jgi:hypothetical protein